MTTIGALVDLSSRRFSGRVAVADGQRSLTYGEVGNRSSRLANALLHLSETRGSRVAVLMSNRIEFVEADFAIAKAAKVKAPINPRLTDDERCFILANCGADVIITEQHEVERLEALRKDLPDLKHIVSVDGHGAYDDLIARANASLPRLDIDPDQPSMILHTSGTTGRPKGATTSQRARISATAKMLLDEFAATENDGMIHVAPMSHGSGSKILAYYLRGARNITLSKFEPEAFFAAVETLGGTSSFMVPTMIRMLLDAVARGHFDPSGIRNLSYGGAPMPAALAEEALSVFGPVLTQVYGSCEAPHPVTVLSSAEHVSDAYEHLGTIGHETFGVETRIVSESGSDAPPGGHGELWIRGDNVMNGYWGDDEATREAFSEGWYRSGDVAQRSEDGFISIVGRQRDMLISGGLNVYPAEVESVLHRHRDISESAVFGTPDAMWGEVVTAAIVLREGKTFDEADIVRHCREYLADYKKPRRIMVVGSLPKGTTGKVSKADLLELATDGSHVGGADVTHH